MSRKQLAAYEFHGVDIARTALVLGNLILKLDQEESLPMVTLTAKPLSLLLNPISLGNFTGSKSLTRYLLKPIFRSLDIAFTDR